MTNDLNRSIKTLVNPGLSDSEIILSGAALLDNHLESLLKAALQGPPDDIAYLTRNASQRRILAHAIGLISKEQAYDLKLISRIRNNAAHSLRPLDFSDGQVTGALGSFTNFHVWRDENLDLRSIFVKTVFSLAVSFNNKLAKVRAVRDV